MSDQPSESPVAIFNYAHSYAMSATELELRQVSATHWNAPVFFLYFHAIELYLKSFLVAKEGLTEDQLRDKYGHKVRKLVSRAKSHGLVLDEKEEEAVNLMDESDNIISSRYIRVGSHQRLPFAVWANFCRNLHTQIVEHAYAGSNVTRRPTLWI